MRLRISTKFGSSPRYGRVVVVVMFGIGFTCQLSMVAVFVCQNCQIGAMMNKSWGKSEPQGCSERPFDLVLPLSSAYDWTLKSVLMTLWRKHVVSGIR